MKRQPIGYLQAGKTHVIGASLPWKYWYNIICESTGLGKKKKKKKAATHRNQRAKIK